MAEHKKLATEIEAREVAEQAREQDWGKRSFCLLYTSDAADE